jgi:hypothetical protein
MTHQASEQNFNTVVIGGVQAGLVEAKSGRQVEIRQWNELPGPVATHLHGGKALPRATATPPT